MLGDKYSRDKTTTPTPLSTRRSSTTPTPLQRSSTTPTPSRTRRSITPGSITPIKSPSPSLPPNEDCEGAHSHKRCSCFRRPRPPPPKEPLNAFPLRKGLKKKTSSASMSGSTPNYSSSPALSTPDKQRYGRAKTYNFDDSVSTTPAGAPPSSVAESSTPAGPPPSSSYLGSSMIPAPQFGSSRSGGSSRSLQFGTPVGQTPKLPKMKSITAFNKPVHGIYSSPSAKRYNQQKKEEPLRSGLNRNTSALRPNHFFQPPSSEQDEDEMDEVDDRMDEGDEGDDSYDMRGGEDPFGGHEQDESMEDHMNDHHMGGNTADFRQSVEEDEEDDLLGGNTADFRQSVMEEEDLMVEGDYDEQDEWAELAHLEKLSRKAEDDDDSDLLLASTRRSQNKASIGSRFGDTMRDTDKDLQYEAIARDMYNRSVVPNIHESDDLLLETEELVMKIYDALRDDESEQGLDRVMNEVTPKLVRLWEEHHFMTAPSATNEYDLAIGPDPGLSAFANANFLAGLLLQLYMPAMPNTTSGPSRMSFRASSKPQATHEHVPIPKILLDWIEKHHNPLPSLLNDLSRHQPTPSASRSFWKDIQSGLLRGKIPDVAQILRDAGWKNARGTSTEDFGASMGYEGPALRNIEREVKELVTLLEDYCPGMHGDWNTQSSDWQMFRVQAQGACNKLKKFAEGEDLGDDDDAAYGRNSFALQSRIAKSKVPWAIYQNLKVLYDIICGSRKAIIEASTDWCEATVGLVVWWDEGTEDNRVVLGGSRFRGDDGDPANYLRKLKRSVKRSLDDSTGFPISTSNPNEIGLICVFRGDIEAAIGIIRIWSLPLASSVAEIAALGGWLPRTEPRSLITMGTLDLNDLEILGLTGPNDRNDGIKDNTLNKYASSLATYHRLESKHLPNKVVRDSWELALSVLGRLDDASRSEESVGQLLEIIPIESTETLDKIIQILNQTGLAHHAHTHAEKYADTLADSTQQFGEALWYYARAHNPQKVKEVLNLLISYSLVESRSFPPTNNLDPYLSRLISDKKATLEELEKIDFQASQLIQKYLSGYAVLRQYYDARDEQVLASDPTKVRKWQGKKNKASLQRLITLINSSSDNIRGGLFDESCDAVLSVEFLIVLLGEALPFVSQPGTESIITIQHIEVLLRAIEDLQTVSSRVYDPCNEFFCTVLASASGLRGSNPGDLLMASTESGMGRSQSQFSLAGSSLMASQLRKSMGGSGILVSRADIKRGWDWRKGLSSTTTAEDVLSILRLGIAKDLARCWIDEADGNF